MPVRGAVSLFAVSPIAHQQPGPAPPAVVGDRNHQGRLKGRRNVESLYNRIGCAIWAEMERRIPGELERPLAPDDARDESGRRPGAAPIKGIAVADSLLLFPIVPAGQEVQRIGGIDGEADLVVGELVG